MMLRFFDPVYQNYTQQEFLFVLFVRLVKILMVIFIYGCFETVGDNIFIEIGSTKDGSNRGAGAEFSGETVELFEF